MYNQSLIVILKSEFNRMSWAYRYANNCNDAWSSMFGDAAYENWMKFLGMMHRVFETWSQPVYDVLCTYERQISVSFCRTSSASLGFQQPFALDLVGLLLWVSEGWLSRSSSPTTALLAGSINRASCLTIEIHKGPIQSSPSNETRLLFMAGPTGIDSFKIIIFCHSSRRQINPYLIRTGYPCYAWQDDGLFEQVLKTALYYANQQFTVLARSLRSKILPRTNTQQI